MTREQIPVIQPTPQCGWNSWGACLAPGERMPSKALIGTLDPCPSEGPFPGQKGRICGAIGLQAQMGCSGFRERTLEDDARDDAGW